MCWPPLCSTVTVTDVNNGYTGQTRPEHHRNHLPGRHTATEGAEEREEEERGEEERCGALALVMERDKVEDEMRMEGLGKD